MKMIGEIYPEIDSSSIRTTAHRSADIEQRRRERQLKRWQKKKDQENRDKAEFRAKFVGPLILIATAVISWVIWLWRG